MKIKENKKRDKYLDFVREAIENEVTVIPIVIGALGTILKGLIKSVGN